MKKIRKIRLKAKPGEKHNRLTALHFLRKEEKTRKHVWLWKCDCGNVVESTISSVRYGNRKSCGCQKIEKCSKYLSQTYRKLTGESCRNTLFTRYKSNAKDRNLDFKLSREYFLSLILQPCYYCGSPPSNRQTVEWNKDIFLYSGLDRTDNRKGYIEGNVVSCCITCNRAKQTLSQDTFLSWVKNVYNNCGLGEG